MVLWMDGREQKSASPKKTAAIEAIEAIERIALRGCGEVRGCLWYAILRWRFVLRLCGGWQNGGGWWIFWKNAKKWGESVEFFCIFCNFA